MNTNAQNMEKFKQILEKVLKETFKKYRLENPNSPKQIFGLDKEAVRKRINRMNKNNCSDNSVGRVADR